MKIRRISGILVLLLAVCFFSTGCFDVSSEFRNVRNHVLRGAGKGYEKDQEFALGPVSLSVAKQFMKSSGDDKKDEELMENISGLQIGIYKKMNPSSGDSLSGRSQLETLNRICSIMERGGWHKMVRSMDKHETSAVFLKLNKEMELTRMFVISMNKNELVLTDIKGNLESLFEAAIRDKGLGSVAMKN